MKDFERQVELGLFFWEGGCLPTIFSPEVPVSPREIL